MNKKIDLGPVTLLVGKNGARFPYCNSIFIKEAGLIIDPACGEEAILDLKKRNQVKTICLTHWHEDHFKYHYLLPKANVWMSENDSHPLKNMGNYLEWYGLDPPELKSLRDIIKKKMENEIHFKSLTPTRFLRDGDKIDLGFDTLKVISTPGHSPGHLSFFFEKQSILFTGDYNLDDFGPWTGDPYSDIDQCIESVNRLRALNAKTVITAHRTEPMTGSLDEHWDRYLKAIDIREGKIMEFLNHPRTIDEITDQWFILGRPMEPLDYFRTGEIVHVKKHIKRLIKSGKVQEHTNHYQTITLRN